MSACLVIDSKPVSKQVISERAIVARFARISLLFNVLEQPNTLASQRIAAMSSYLVTCNCGKTVVVEVGQAGGRVVCTCGATLDVPPLRKLRHLPPADVSSEQARATPRWSAKQGVVATCLILAALLAAYSLWNRLSEPEVPEFNPLAQARNVEEGLKTMAPVQAWRMWVEVYRPLAQRGFTVFKHPHRDAVEQYVSKRRFFQKMLLAVAAAFMLAGMAAAFWPQAKSRRQRDQRE